MKTHSLDEYLHGHAFFRGLAHDDLALLAGCASTAHFDAGKLIAREGGPADVFYVIRSGRVALEIHVPGRGPIVVDTVGEDEILGVSWLVPPYRWQFDVRAVDDVRAIALDGACLRGKCDADPRLGYELLKRISGVLRHRLHMARVRLIDLYGHVAR